MLTTLASVLTLRIKMAFVSPSSVAEAVQKLYEIAKLIQEQVGSAHICFAPLTPPR